MGESDLFEVAMGCCEGNLKARVPNMQWKDGAAATVVCAANGYPGSYPKGCPIFGLEAANKVEGVKVYHAGTKKADSGLVTSGGRVLAVTGVAPDFKAALSRAYQGVGNISFDPPDAKPVSMHYRRDIGHRALSASA